MNTRTGTATLAATVLVVTAVFSANAGTHNCKPAWKCAPPTGTVPPTPRVTASPTVAPTPTVTPTSVPQTSLQAAIDATPSGGVLDLTGQTFAGGATIAKPLTLVGASITGARSRSALTVASSGVTLRGLTITGPQASVYDGSERGIDVRGTASSPIDNLVIEDSVIRRFGYGGMYVNFVTDFAIRDNVVSDGVYAGIMVITGVRGTVSGNTVERIGVVGAGANGNNAYGIALTQALSTSPRSTDITVSGNTITDVPTWHALDTHGGARLTWTGNTVRGSRSGIFITGWSTNRALDNVISQNVFYDREPASDHYAITSVFSTGGSVTGNRIVGWAPGREILTTSSGNADATAINLSISGNVIEP